MVNLDTFNEQFAQVERDILESNGEVTLVLTGPHPCGHGPGPDGQLSVAQWDNDIQDAEQWLRDHGARDELEADSVRLPANDQLVVVRPRGTRRRSGGRADPGP